MRDSVTAALRMRSVLTRREVLEEAWLSFGTLALTQLLARDHVALAQPPASNQPGGVDLRLGPATFPPKPRRRSCSCRPAARVTSISSTPSPS